MGEGELAERARKGGTTRMSYQCACLFTTSDRDTFTDHVLEVFNPGDDIGTDGQVHAELADHERLCICGFTADSWPGLDAHLLAMFITPNGVGLDGVKHTTSLPAMT
jgi:hypothetical protein